MREKKKILPPKKKCGMRISRRRGREERERERERGGEGVGGGCWWRDWCRDSWRDWCRERKNFDFWGRCGGHKEKTGATLVLEGDLGAVDCCQEICSGLQQMVFL